jgi:hypothetical protein
VGRIDLLLMSSAAYSEKGMLAMNPVSVQHAEAQTIRTEDCLGLECERQLRIAAAMLAREPAGEISATTVVGELRPDEERRFEGLVAEIADEYALDATLRLGGGSFSVRFSVPSKAEEDGGARVAGAPSWLTRFLPSRHQAA